MSVTYGINGSTSQVNPASSPWTKEETSSSPINKTSLVVENLGGGNVTCKINEEGKVVQHVAFGDERVARCTSP